MLHSSTASSTTQEVVAVWADQVTVHPTTIITTVKAITILRCISNTRAVTAVAVAAGPG